MHPSPDESAPPAVSHFAARAGDHNDRAMAATPALASALTQRLGLMPDALHVVGKPAPALAADWQSELTAARPALQAIAARFGALLRAECAPFTALSRCAVALATVPQVLRYHPDAVVVWLDAHADLNTPDSTTSGYLGGLALSGPLGLWDSGLGQGLTGQRTVLVGARDLDPFEQRLIEQGLVTLVAPGPAIAERVAAAVAGRPVYVHLDCDVLEPGQIPTDYQVPGGLSLAELHATMQALTSSRIIGMEIAEFEVDPADTSAATTLQAAERLLDALQPVLSTSRCSG